MLQQKHTGRYTVHPYPRDETLKKNALSNVGHYSVVGRHTLDALTTHLQCPSYTWSHLGVNGSGLTRTVEDEGQR